MRSALRALYICQTAKTITQIRQMPEPKTRARFKGSNFGTTHSVQSVVS